MPDAIPCCWVAVTRMSCRLAGGQNNAANDVTDSLHFQGLIVRPAQNSQRECTCSRGSQCFLCQEPFVTGKSDGIPLWRRNVMIQSRLRIYPRSH